MAANIPSVPVRASRARALLRLLGAAATFIVVGCVQFGQAARALRMFELPDAGSSATVKMCLDTTIP